MKFLSNATFLINISRVQPTLLDALELSTIKEVLEEVKYYTGDVYFQKNIKRIEVIKDRYKTIKRQKHLSYTDIKLLEVAFNRNALLITDDLRLRSSAKSRGIKTYTTPLFMAYLLKNGVLNKKECIRILAKLNRVYIRPRDVQKVIEKVKRW